MKILTVHGKEKEIEFVDVNADSGRITIYFTDKTYINLTNIDVYIR